MAEALATSTLQFVSRAWVPQLSSPLAPLLAGAKAGHRLPAGPTRLSVLGGPRLPACTAAALRWPDCDDAVTDQVPQPPPPS